MVEICAHHLHTDPEPPSSRLGHPLPEDLERTILMGLRKRPEDRFPTVRAFRQALAACPIEPRWTDDQAQAWWAQHRQALVALRRSSPVSQSGRTVAVDLDQRD